MLIPITSALPEVMLLNINYIFTLQKLTSMGYAPVNGINMYYEIHGEGEPLVLIHGGGSTIQTSFGHILPLLAKKYKVIAVELQAHGHTSDRDAPESFEQDADDVAGLVSHLAISKAHFLGFSNGGSTALQIGIRHPQIVNKLVAASAIYKREGMIPGFFEGMVNATLADMPEFLQKDFLRVNNDGKALQTMFEKDRDRMIGFKDWPDAILNSISCPVLVMNGNRDVVTNEHAVELSRQIPNSELIILPGQHGAFFGEGLEDPTSKLPSLTVELITEFLDK